jgi:hypothetical protein
MFLDMKTQSRTTGSRHRRKAGQDDEGARETTVQGETLLTHETNINHRFSVPEAFCVDVLSHPRVTFVSHNGSTLQIHEHK